MGEATNKAKKTLEALNSMFSSSPVVDKEENDVESDGQFKIMYGTDTIPVDLVPGLTIAGAFRDNADELSFDPSRLVTYRCGSTKVKGTDKPQVGKTYVANVQHEQKG